MLSGIRSNMQVTKCLGGVSLVLILLCLSSGTARAQIPPIPNAATNVTVQFTNSSYTVNENAGTAMLTVTLNTSSSTAVTVNYATSDGTAVAGTDYTATSGTLTFNSGVTSQTISVGIIDNHNYSGQTVYFTVTLSNVSSNAALASPYAVNVNILDNDPAPSVTIVPKGVPMAQRNNPGGFVCVNANNDNGSKLTYSNGDQLQSGDTIGIPTSRDFSVSPLKTADPDLLELDIQTQNTNGTETMYVLSSSSGRAKTQIWADQKKSSQISDNSPIVVKGLPNPYPVFAEGTLEGAALREVTVTVEMQDNKSNVIATDTCTLTVTPVLTKLVVTATDGISPALVKDSQGNWVIDSAAGGQTYPFTAQEEAQWNAVRGVLRFIQNVKNVNNLTGTKGGVPHEKWTPS